MGTCFGIVPYVDSANSGTIAGIVGAGGNVGAVLFLNIFRSKGDTFALYAMATFCLFMAFLTPFIVIKGYKGIIFGREAEHGNRSLLIARNGNAPLLLDSSKDDVSA